MLLFPLIICTSSPTYEQEIYEFRTNLRKHHKELFKLFKEFQKQITSVKDTVIKNYPTIQKNPELRIKFDVKPQFVELQLSMNILEKRVLLKYGPETDTIDGLLKLWFEKYFENFLIKECDPLKIFKKEINYFVADSSYSSNDKSQYESLYDEIVFNLGSKHEKFLVKIAEMNEEFKEEYLSEKRRDSAKTTFVKKLSELVGRKN